MALRLALAPILVVLALVSASPLPGANGPGGAIEPAAFAHGRVELTASKQGAILSSRGLAPGDRVSGSLTIANTGTLAGSFTLSGGVQGSARLAGRLQLTVREQTHGLESRVFSGRLSGLRAVRLGLIGPGQARTFRFAVLLPASAGDDFQGLWTSADFSWTAVQAS